MFSEHCILMAQKHFAFRARGNADGRAAREWEGCSTSKHKANSIYPDSVEVFFILLWACKNTAEKHGEEAFSRDPLAPSASAWIRNTMRTSLPPLVTFQHSGIHLQMERNRGEQKRKGRKTQLNFS